jgi:uncharacterized membrane protein YdfJ with MMPL/SSD domain
VILSPLQMPHVGSRPEHVGADCHRPDDTPVATGTKWAEQPRGQGGPMNDAVSWLPGNAESARMIQASAQFQPKDEIPATVVYERAGGVTPQDMAVVTDMRSIATDSPDGQRPECRHPHGPWLRGRDRLCPPPDRPDREELRRHEDRHEAMAFALHRVGPAIFASGSTVIAGMLCLLVATMNSTQGLGPVAAVGIAAGLMVMLTLLPALLVIFGRWFCWPVHPTFGSVDHTATGVWAKVGARIARAPGAQVIAGGDSATRGDILQAASNDNKVIIPLILFVVFLILMLLLRAVVAPLILIGTVVLSFGAAMGLSSLVFRHVFNFAGADSSLPLFVFVFLVALGIDYNIFLMTRVHEEARQFGTRRGALIGLAATGGVITSAGLVLAGTFSVLATLPVVAFAEIGFAVALGVLFDTLIVRSVLVTALNLDVGWHMWWPSSLANTPDSERQPRRATVAHEGATSGALRRTQTD